MKKIFFVLIIFTITNLNAQITKSGSGGSDYFEESSDLLTTVDPADTLQVSNLVVSSASSQLFRAVSSGATAIPVIEAVTEAAGLSGMIFRQRWSTVAMDHGILASFAGTTYSSKSVNGMTFFVRTNVATSGFKFYNYANDLVLYISSETGNQFTQVGGDVKPTGTYNYGAGDSLQIASGAVTVTKGWHEIGTEDGVAIDTLTTINGGTKGDILIITPISDTRTVFVENASGNINHSAGDITQDDLEEAITFLYTGSVWIVLSNSAN